MWTPISREEIIDLITAFEESEREDLKKIWQLVKISPEKWAMEEEKWKEDTFWVVAIWGTKVMWYNDVEEGFNISEYTAFRLITTYGAEQDKLRQAMMKTQRLIQHALT